MITRASGLVSGLLLLLLAGCGMTDNSLAGKEAPRSSSGEAHSPRAFVYLKLFRSEQGKPFPTILITPDPGATSPDLDRLVSSVPIDLRRFALSASTFAALAKVLTMGRPTSDAMGDEVYEWGFSDRETLRFRLGRADTLKLLKQARSVINLKGSPLDDQLDSLITRLSH